ncbi:hypothetical protein U1Q18_011089, partial [Sarracenia purpurea var. burkii]
VRVPPTKASVALIPLPPGSISAQPLTSLQYSNFLEPSCLHHDPPPISSAPLSSPVTQSSFNMCAICIDLVYESLQDANTFVGPSSPTSASGPLSHVT